MTKPVLFVVSYAGIRAINRAVYAQLQQQAQVVVAVPCEVTAASGLVVPLEPPVAGEGTLVGHRIRGRNPRTLTFDGLAKTLEQARPQVILYEGDPSSKLAWQLANWSKRHGAKLICQTYDNIDRSWSAGVGKSWRTRIINLLISSFSRLMISRIYLLLVVNRAGERAFSKIGYQNIVRTPLGFDSSIFFPESSLREATRQRLQIKTDTVVVAYFGRMVRQKGVHVLVEALSQIRELNWHLLLDDDFDPQDSYAKEIRDLLLNYEFSARVTYFKATHHEIADYMRACEIAVAPSLTTSSFTEQYGRAVQEAMACGCLVLVSNTGHLPDLVDDHELVFSEGNAIELATRLRFAIENGVWRRKKIEQLVDRATRKLTIKCQADLIAPFITSAP